MQGIFLIYEEYFHNLDKGQNLEFLKFRGERLTFGQKNPNPSLLLACYSRRHPADGSLCDGGHGRCPRRLMCSQPSSTKLRKGRRPLLVGTMPVGGAPAGGLLQVGRWPTACPGAVLPAYGCTHARAATVAALSRFYINDFDAKSFSKTQNT